MERKLDYFCSKCGSQVVETRGKATGFLHTTGERIYRWKAKCPIKRHWWDGHFGGFSPSAE